jgi:hypothetical protein
MFRQYLLVGVPVLALMGCINEPSNDSAKSPASDPGQERDIDINSLEKPLQIKVGDKSVNLYKGPDGILLVESIQPKGETSLLTPEMKGWTWERIQEKLQPEANPAPGLGGLVYEGERPGAAESPLAEGDQGGSGYLGQDGGRRRLVPIQLLPYLSPFQLVLAEPVEQRRFRLVELLRLRSLYHHELG